MGCIQARTVDVSVCNLQGSEVTTLWTSILWVPGFFVFIATFFSGLLLDAVKAGNVEIPYEGFVTSLLGVNSTDLSS